MYISTSFFRCCLGFNLMIMLGFHGSTGLTRHCGQWSPMLSVGQESNAYGYLFLCLAQYGNTGKCPSFSCMDSFLTLLICRFMLMCTFNSAPESVPCQSNNNMQKTRKCRCLKNTISQKGLHLVCAKLGPSAFSSMATRRNQTDQRIK